MEFTLNLEEYNNYKQDWQKLMFILIYGAMKDIITFAQLPPLVKLQNSYNNLSFRERRVKMKEYWRTKRRSEKACEWIDGGKPKRNSKVHHVSFQEACEGLNKNTTKVREGIKSIVRKVLKERNNYE